ncbi:MAG: bifunctional metallophosphatase/5'-nucleotidase [Butyrivibrio sp.]|uniref:bifunctional metallophosphatase/5'-nucleotidase n=1 Tax=Butyrivibrio sp. TaxID=28121 RepID=UPI001B5DB703|nr:bifunctional UDP-sugar hydrolase/5'-nucleotidase [Butyrivibrio sp.]MBP3781689.1 bifunctional metallophosphatase/5'-nucleotidase [Butyrivibrio sp.]
MTKHSVVKRIGSIVMAMALVLSLGMPSLTVRAAEPVKEKSIYDLPADFSGKTVILHTNDIHGAVGRYAYIASVRENLAGRGAEVILADAGDFGQGTAYVSTTKGLDAISCMNAAGYDIVTPGNHEFDYGVPQLKANLATAKFQTVCASVLDGNGNSLFQQHAIITKGGVKIGFYGLETPETTTKAKPEYVRAYKFLEGKDLYNCSQAQVDALKAEGADIIVCIAHLGVDGESTAKGCSSVDVFKNTKGIDFMLDGHSHTVMSASSNNLPIQSAGTKLQDIGVVVIDNATKKIEDNYLLSLEGLQKEVIADAVTTAIIKRVDAEYDQAFGKSEVELNGAKAPGNRTEETNMGDLVTDALLWTVTQNASNITVDKDHIVAITNGGGIRAAIHAGSVTKKDINTVLPFGNTVAVAYLTGAELLEALEASTYNAPDALGGYPQTAGIKFTLDTRKSFAKGPNYPESTYAKPSSINRVTIESINGKPFSKDDTYAVVTNNFCTDGGDTYYVFRNSSAQFDTGIVMDEAVMDYVKTELHGVISADKYAQPRGDQTILK